jgi:steroid 5-alpha reductase family enzyme
MQRKSKGVSLAVITAIYLIAFAVGTACIVALKGVLSPLWNLFVADVVATIVVFISNLIFDNASTYDPYWSVQPILVAIAIAVFYNGSLAMPACLTLVPLLLWAIRLTGNWVKGFDNLAWEDWRYADYKKQYPRAAQFIVFTGIMLMPTVLVFLGCIPLWYLMTAGNVSPLFPALGGIVILIGTGFEFFADRQMKAYKRDKGAGVQGKSDSGLPYIYRGLWKFLRHPNYLGEMLIWVGVFVSGLGREPWFACVGMILVIILFTTTSIPLMEKHMLARTPLYKEYRAKVRCFL